MALAKEKLKSLYYAMVATRKFEEAVAELQQAEQLAPGDR